MKRPLLRLLPLGVVTCFLLLLWGIRPVAARSASAVLVAAPEVPSWECYAPDRPANPCNYTLGAVEMVSPTEGWFGGDRGLTLHWQEGDFAAVQVPTTDSVALPME